MEYDAISCDLFSLKELGKLSVQERSHEIYFWLKIPFRNMFKSCQIKLPPGFTWEISWEMVCYNICFLASFASTSLMFLGMVQEKVFLVMSLNKLGLDSPYLLMLETLMLLSDLTSTETCNWPAHKTFRM